MTRKGCAHEDSTMSGSEPDETGAYLGVLPCRPEGDGIAGGLYLSYPEPMDTRFSEPASQTKGLCASTSRLDVVLSPLFAGKNIYRPRRRKQCASSGQNCILIPGQHSRLLDRNLRQRERITLTPHEVCRIQVLGQVERTICQLQDPQGSEIHECDSARVCAHTLYGSWLYRDDGSCAR